jgi:hypothetical protein
MDIDTFKKRFQNYSDKELILMLTKSPEKYNPDALLVAKEILNEREVDIETIIQNAKEDVEELTDFEKEKRYIDNLSALDQIEYLSEKRVEFEENIEEIIEANNENLTEDEILSDFENILDIVIKNDCFGGITEIHSKENYFITSNIIEEKKVKISFLLIMKIDRVNMIARRDFRKKFNKNIIYGFLIFSIGLVLTIATGGALIMYGAVLSGLAMILRGFFGRIQLKNESQNVLEAVKNNSI